VEDIESGSDLDDAVELDLAPTDLVVAIEEGCDRYGTDFVVAWKRL
jgi:hypothetical protein